MQEAEPKRLDLSGLLDHSHENKWVAIAYRLALRVLPSHDFREGVRAVLVDKDKSPQWQPSSLAGVGDLDAFFAPLGQRELFAAGN